MTLKKKVCSAESRCLCLLLNCIHIMISTCIIPSSAHYFCRDRLEWCPSESKSSVLPLYSLLTSVNLTKWLQVNARAFPFTVPPTLLEKVSKRDVTVLVLSGGSSWMILFSVHRRVVLSSSRSAQRNQTAYLERGMIVHINRMRHVMSCHVT